MLPVLACAAGSAARCSPAVAVWQRAIGAAYRLYTTAELQVTEGVGKFVLWIVDKLL